MSSPLAVETFELVKQFGEFVAVVAGSGVIVGRRTVALGARVGAGVGTAACSTAVAGAGVGASALHICSKLISGGVIELLDALPTP